MNVLKHMRRPTARRDKGDWVIDCDCGWRGRTSCTSGAIIKPGAQVEDELEQAFRDHLPEDERVLYILVDQRQVEVFEDGNAESDDPENDVDRKLISVARGNFVMPIGTPINLLKWYWKGDERWASYMNLQTGEVGDLVIGEIRTADNRVFKLDSDG